jgi:DNA-binding transcriptional LysR family regulator
MPTSGVLYRWEFEQDGVALEVAPAGAPVLNDPDLSIAAALDGIGLVYTGEAFLEPYLAQGRLARVLEDWCPAVPGFFLYYPSRRQASAALRALVDALRLR